MNQDLVPPSDPGEVLPCPLCGKPVQKGDWFIISSQAIETVATGTPYAAGTGRADYVPQRPVHLTCLGGPRG
jgi:hypothetical protein